MKVTIDYPVRACFVIRTELKRPAKYGDEARTRLLQRWLARNKADSPCHAYGDYIVEFVRTSKDGNEYWGVGS